jgi:hypothetical protein
MGIFINGMPANTPEEKRKAIESQGGTYNKSIKGGYVEVKGNKSSSFSNNFQDVNIGNYADTLSGDSVQQAVQFNFDDDFDNGNQTPGTGNYTENLQGNYINLANQYTISYGGYDLVWNQHANNRYIGSIEVKDEDYELKAILDREQSKFVCYIPGIVAMGNGIEVDSLNDVKIIEWAVVAIQENF